MVVATIGLRALAASTFLLLPQISAAQELREFCPDRPGLCTPACTIDRDHLAVEVGLVDWTRDRQAGSRTDTLVAGDTLIRYGVTDTLEAQLGWAAYGRVRTRSGGTVDTNSGVGDVTLALRRNLRNPDGSDLSTAVMPFVTLPIGGSTIGAGDWGAGLLLPVSSELPGGFGLSFTGSVAASVDADRDGRHLTYGGVVGLDVPLGEDVGATFELAAMRDRDPAGAATNLIAAVSAAWSPSSSLQLDAGVNFGLNRDTPDMQISVGVARQF